MNFTDFSLNKLMAKIAYFFNYFFTNKLIKICVFDWNWIKLMNLKLYLKEHFTKRFLKC